MITKVVIAAAGQGTRMLKLSKNKPKHLIKVRKRPFLAYVLDNLILAGYSHCIIVAGFRAELIEDFVKKYMNSLPPEKRKKIKIEVVNQYKILGGKEKEYGTLCPLKCVKDKVENDNFIYLYGDNLFSVSDLKAMNINDEFCYVGGLRHSHPERYGVLVKDGKDFLEKIIEKPKEPVGDLINAGLYKLTPEIFDVIPLVKKSPRGEYEVTDAISILAPKKRVKIKELKDYWLDFGNPGHIVSVSKFINHKKQKR